MESTWTTTQTTSPSTGVPVGGLSSDAFGSSRVFSPTSQVLLSRDESGNSSRSPPTGAGSGSSVASTSPPRERHLQNPPSLSTRFVESAAANGSGFDEKRQGKWTRAECEYAMVLIEHFTSGRLPGCSGGESLRTTLAECLQCTPMRITKKLSSKHAIGKCCFKKKGELSAKERDDLEESRLAFEASVEKRGGQQRSDSDQGSTGAGAAPRKRTRVDDEATISLDDSLFDPADNAPDNFSDTATAGSAKEGTGSKSWILPPHSFDSTNRSLAPSVSARLTQDGRTKIRVVGRDRMGLLGEISNALQKKNVSVCNCVCQTLDGGVAHDEFDVVYAGTKRPITRADELRHLEDYLEQALANTLSNTALLDDNDSVSVQHSASGGGGIDDAASEASSVRTKGSEVPKRATTLQVTVPDRPGLLKQITTTLEELSLSILEAKIDTVDSNGGEHEMLSSSPQKTALDTFAVVDRETGEPVLDAERLRDIEHRLFNDLQVKCNSIPPPAPPSGGGQRGRASSSSSPPPAGPPPFSSSTSIDTQYTTNGAPAPAAPMMSADNDNGNGDWDLFSQDLDIM